MQTNQKADPTERVEWDEAVTSLGRRIRSDGAVRWIVQMRVDGRMRKRVIGDGERLSAEDARRAAIVAMERMRIGAPVEERAKPPAPFVSVREFGERYLADHAPHWKPATRLAHHGCLERRVYPVIGDRRVAHLTRADILDWRKALTVSPASINRAMAVLSGMMRHAEVLGVRQPGSNPCKGLRRKATAFKAAYLSDKGYAALGRTLRAMSNEHPTEVALIRFLALTGCRRSEALSMEWDWVTEDAVNLPDSKTGPKAIWLGDAARGVLNRLDRSGRHVFMSGGAPLAAHQMERFWQKVRTRMKKPDLRIHDLRHSFAAAGVSAGEDLGTIGGLLGHADKGTTAGYAHLAETPVKAAAARVGKLIEKKTMMKRKMTSARREALRDDKWADVRAFRKSGITITKWCEKHGADPDRLRDRIVEWRKMAEAV